MNIAALKRAVKASAAWKGGITGHPDPAVEEEFDLEILKQRKAVESAERMLKGVRHAVERCDAAGQHTIADELRQLLK